MEGSGVLDQVADAELSELPRSCLRMASTSVKEKVGVTSLVIALVMAPVPVV